MHTMRIPPGLSDCEALHILAGTYAKLFSNVGLTCVEMVLAPGPGWLAVRDPHKHLHDPEIRGHLRDEIRRVCEPGLVAFVREALLGPGMA